MRLSRMHFMVWLAGSLVACSSSGGTSGNTAGSSAGGESSGGSTATGGATHTGGSKTGGTGNTTSGGSGGTSGSGGKTNTGGTPATGGTAGGGGYTGPNPGCSTKGAAGANGIVAPADTWVNVTANLAGMSSQCGNLTMVSAKPDEDLVIAGVAGQGLWSTRDGGTSWVAMGKGAGSATITNRPTSIVYDPTNTNVFWESGIYNGGGGVFRSDDDGATFKQLGSITHNDIVSVDFTDPARKTLLASGHEAAQTLYRSTDGGQTWTNVGTNLPSGTNFSSAPLVLDANTHLVGVCGYPQTKCGIWRTVDGGQTWGQVSDISAVSQPLWACNGFIYYPIIYNRGLARSVDDGQHWLTALGQGTVASSSPIELPDGRLVTVAASQTQLWILNGTQWVALGKTIPFKASGVAYSAQRKKFYVWHNDCNGAVLSNAIMSAGFDWQK